MVNPASPQVRYCISLITLCRGVVRLCLVMYRDKRQMSSDHVENGRYKTSDIDHGRRHPWKLQNRYSNSFTSAEQNLFDTAFFRVPGEHCLPVIRMPRERVTF